MVLFYNTIIAYLNRHKEWSEKTFGIGDNTISLVAHIKKELEEVLTDYNAKVIQQIPEWIDVLILAFDGLLREGFSPEAIMDLLEKKLSINENRTWNKVKLNIGKPIEHKKE